MAAWRGLPRRSFSKGENYKVFVDRDMNIWLAEPGQGFKLYPARIRCKGHPEILSRIDAEVVRNIASDSRGRLWMSVDDGYACYDPAGEKVIWRETTRKQFTHLFLDSRDRIWTVEDLCILKKWRIGGDGVPVEEKSYRFDSIIASVSEDMYGTIWVVNNFKFHSISPEGKVREYGPITINGSKKAHTIALSDPSSRKVYVSTVRNGIFQCSQEGMEPVDLGGVASVNSLMTSTDGTVWMGSFNEGLIHFNPSNGSVQRFNISTGLSSNSVKSVIEDKRGRIWFNTASHIICYDPISGKFNTLYDRNFNDTDYYSLRCVTKTPDGRIWFGGYGGVTEVDENQEFAEEEEKNKSIPLQFEYFAVNDKQISERTQRIELNHKEKVLTIMFSGLNFRTGSVLNYAYMLEGLDKDWIDTDKLRVVLSNIPPGRYRFKVKARLMNGEWGGNEISIPVVVKPSPWLSLPAKISYAVLILAMMFLAIRFWIRQRMREKDLAMKQEHLDFITNVSHELKTPLSLIIAPLKMLRKNPSLGEKDEALLDMMDRNAAKLMQISEEIMDTPKARAREEALMVSVTDASAMVHGIVNNLRFSAMEKGLKIDTDIQKGVHCYLDSLKVEKILINLLNNACKYTPESGEIKVSLNCDGSTGVFVVSDNGSGIPEEKRASIFDRFERLDMDRKAPGTSGSGIGLNYSLRLARLHKGRLSYSPGPDGKGSIFTFSVPCSENAYSASEICRSEGSTDRNHSLADMVNPEFKPGRPGILIAEDNDEIRALLCELFSDSCNVILAKDGLEASESLKVAIPDLIISDIVMPNRNGYALCEYIRKSPDYCHIPVILLTAKTDKESNLKGLGEGADAYIGKPFDPDLLAATVQSLIVNRKMIQQRVLNMTPQELQDDEKVKMASLSEQEVRFLEKIHGVIESHIEEEDYSINDISKELGMSYSKLYAKVKTLTGQTPQSFISTFKMNKAMMLLKSGDYNVSEVADMVGASSPFNFSRDFKKHFGITPSAVIKGQECPKQS